VLKHCGYELDAKEEEELSKKLRAYDSWAKNEAETGNIREELVRTLAEYVAVPLLTRERNLTIKKNSVAAQIRREEGQENPSQSKLNQLRAEYQELVNHLKPTESAAAKLQEVCRKLGKNNEYYRNVVDALIENKIGVAPGEKVLTVCCDDGGEGLRTDDGL